MYTLGIITISDKGAAGQREDKSGPKIKESSHILMRQGKLTWWMCMQRMTHTAWQPPVAR